MTSIKVDRLKLIEVLEKAEKKFIDEQANAEKQVVILTKEFNEALFKTVSKDKLVSGSIDRGNSTVRFSLTSKEYEKLRKLYDTLVSYKNKQRYKGTDVSKSLRALRLSTDKTVLIRSTSNLYYYI